jgi:hypothetical protein
MDIPTTPDAIWVHTQVFPSWSVTVPRSLAVIDPTTAVERGYWHARDEQRSVSLTSLILVDVEQGDPVPASEIIDIAAGQILPRGRKVTDGPQGLLSRAVHAKGGGVGPASRRLQGLIAADGIALLVTISSDDEAWCRRVWMSVRHTPEVAAAMEMDAPTDELVGAASA